MREHRIDLIRGTQYHRGALMNRLGLDVEDAPPGSGDGLATRRFDDHCHRIENY